MVIGLTVVSFGTSTRALVTLKQLLWVVQIGCGNIVGSNIANIALVLGVMSFIPIVLDRSNILFNWAFMMLATLLLLLFNQWMD